MTDESTDTLPAATDSPEMETTTTDEGKLPQTVEVTEVGPCKKHIKVTVGRKAIDERLDEQYTKLVRSDEFANQWLPSRQGTPQDHRTPVQVVGV